MKHLTTLTRRLRQIIRHSASILPCVLILFFGLLLIRSERVISHDAELASSGPTRHVNADQAAVQSIASPAMRLMPPDGAAFLTEQRFDIRAEALAGAIGSLRVWLDGHDISDWNNRSRLTGGPSDHPPSAPINGGATFLSRQWSFARPGRHTLRASIGEASSEVSFEIVDWRGRGGGVRNIILLIGDGMGVAQRTAARIVSRGLKEGVIVTGCWKWTRCP